MEKDHLVIFLPLDPCHHLPATLTSLLVVEVYGARVVYLGRCVADLLRFVNVDYFVQSRMLLIPTPHQPHPQLALRTGKV